MTCCNTETVARSACPTQGEAKLEALAVGPQINNACRGTDVVAETKLLKPQFGYLGWV